MGGSLSIIVKLVSNVMSSIKTVAPDGRTDQRISREDWKERERDAKEILKMFKRQAYKDHSL